MCDFKPGDEVVCVDDSQRYGFAWAGDIPVKGQVYTVVEVAPYYRGPAVRLVEIKNRLPSGETGYNAARFRKVQRRDLTAWLATFTDFEEPKRAPVTEPA